MARRKSSRRGRDPGALLAAGDRQGALRAFRRQAEKGMVDAMFHLGTLLAEDRDEQGVVWLQRAHERAPGEAAIQNNLGHALRDAGRLDDARAVFEAAVGARPSDAVALYGLGTVHVSAGRSDLAEGPLRRAVAADPTFVIAVRQHGDVLEALGRTSEALETFQRALALQPRDPQVLRKLGLMYAFLGRTSVGIAMLRQALSMRPDDPLASHMLGALTGQGEERADDAYVRELFDAFADHFDAQLQDVLAYRVPERVASLVGEGPLGEVLDLGCGTGLLAPYLAGRTRRLVGIDLSPGMLAKARARGGYDVLEVEGIVPYLERASRDGDGFDLVIAADVFVYVGGLEEVFAGVRCCCRGRFVFTTELADEGLELRPSGRYAHGEGLVDDLASRHGFRLAHRSTEVLRMDGGTPVQGQIVVLELAHAP